jgi:nitrogen fixation/metabolism regulation signal transduction histidine kinase
MAFNSYYLNILLRILLISATNFGFFYFLLKGDRFFTILFLGILFIIQVIWLFLYVNSVNRTLARFLLTLGEEETMVTPLQHQVEKTFRGLQHSFERLNREVGRMRLEKEYASVLIQNTVDQLGSGIVAWNDKGEVELVNRAGLKLLDLSQLDDMQQLEEGYPGTRVRLEGLAEGRRTIITLIRSGANIPFVFWATGFLLGDKTVKLVSFQSIDRELEEHEMVSWEKLIRVLSHEVSNSVTPITTLGANIKKRMSSVLTGGKKKYELEAGMAQDIQRSADLIEQRGLRLIDFVAQYKTMMRMPEPKLKPVSLKDFLSDVCSLCGHFESVSDYKISCNVSPSGLTAEMDRKMMEQVLINLVRNAVEALGEDRDGRIEVLASWGPDDSMLIQVKDNGGGISPEILDQVFIPFFTTKEKGSGIGLSLSRRIVNLHGGSIQMTSESGKGTVVNIILPGSIPDI